MWVCGVTMRSVRYSQPHFTGSTFVKPPIGLAFTTNFSCKLLNFMVFVLDVKFGDVITVADFIGLYHSLDIIGLGYELISSISIGCLLTRINQITLDYSFPRRILSEVTKEAQSRLNHLLGINSPQKQLRRTFYSFFRDNSSRGLQFKAVLHINTRYGALFWTFMLAKLSMNSNLWNHQAGVTAKSQTKL